MVPERIPGETILKDPQSVEPQGFNWTDWLAEFVTTQLIVTSTWTIAGDDAVLTYANDSIVTGSLKTQAVFSAGTIGVKYKITNRIITTSGYTDDRSFYYLVKDR